MSDRNNPTQRELQKERNLICFVSTIMIKKHRSTFNKSIKQTQKA